MNAVQYLRTVVAILCIAAILAGTWNPTSAGLLCALLIPAAICFRFVSQNAGNRRRTRAPHPRLASLVSVLSTRAPPVASFA